MNSTSTAAAPLKWQDFYELCKPNVVLLMLLTSAIGMLLSTRDGVPLAVLFWGNLGIALCAGAAAAVNHVVDRGIDNKMARTLNRPVATGRVSPIQAFVFAALIGGLGMAILLVFTNALTAWLTLASLLGYALVYTMFLKRATPQNIVIGGLAGAAPPLLGWTAVTGEIHHDALLLALIIFVWTPPHFWALAVHRKEEYAKADIPMLPVTHGEHYTNINIVLYTLMLIVVTVLPYLTGMFGWLYLTGALLLGGGFLYWALVMLLTRRENSGMQTFKYSIWYLMALFVVMLVDHYTIAKTPILMIGA